MVLVSRNWKETSLDARVMEEFRAGGVGLSFGGDGVVSPSRRMLADPSWERAILKKDDVRRICGSFPSFICSWLLFLASCSGWDAFNGAGILGGGVRLYVPAVGGDLSGFSGFNIELMFCRGDVCWLGLSGTSGGSWLLIGLGNCCVCCASCGIPFLKCGINSCGAKGFDFRRSFCLLFWNQIFSCQHHLIWTAKTYLNLLFT